MKKAIFKPMILMLFAAMTLSVSCDRLPQEYPNLEEETEEFFVFEDGTVRVPTDNGYSAVNNLKKAIDQFANTTLIASESGNEVEASNVFILPRGSRYYVEGKWVIKNSVVVRAEEGEGEMPIIQIIADETGSVNSDMIRIERDVTFEGIYFFGQDAITGAHQQRMIRIDGAGCTLTLDRCFADYCRNFFIRIDAKNVKVYLRNSTFRNMKHAATSNGRLVDTRGNGAKVVSIENCLVYNILGHITRHDGSVIETLEWKNNTFYNCGTTIGIDHPRKVVIQDNIFVNTGWRQGADSMTVDPETGEIIVNRALWVFSTLDATDLEKADVIIRNNNIYSTPQMLALYDKYSDSAAERTELNSRGQTLQAIGKLQYQDNFSEELTFERPAPIRYDFIDLFFSDPNASDDTFIDIPFFVDEDGINGIHIGDVFTFSYPATARSATASTAGGRIGAVL